MHRTKRKITISLLAVVAFSVLFSGTALSKDYSHFSPWSWNSGNKPDKPNGRPFNEIHDELASLQAQIDALQTSGGPFALFVDCDLGDTIGDALASQDGSAEPLTISVSGTCHESVFINRSEVRIVGITGSDSIVSDTDPAILIENGSTAVNIDSFSMSTTGQGASALACIQGSQAIIANSTMTASNGSGAVVASGAQCTFINSVIDGRGAGLAVTSGANALLEAVTASGSNTGLVVAGNSTARLLPGGTPNMITNNSFGIRVEHGSYLDVVSATVENNSNGGVSVITGGTLVLPGNAQFELNSNSGAGLFLGENTFLDVSNRAQVSITGNIDYDVYCEGQLTFTGSLSDKNVGFIGALCPAGL